MLHTFQNTLSHVISAECKGLGLIHIHSPLPDSFCFTFESLIPLLPFRNAKRVCFQHFQLVSLYFTFCVVPVKF